MRKIILAAAVAMLPITALAQTTGGAAGGAGGADAATGGSAGAGAAGPSGGGTGEAGGAAGGSISRDMAPRFRAYVIQQQVPSYSYREDVRVGAVLPEGGVTYREVPAEYGVSGYRYTIVNDQPVIVEPRTRRVIQVIE